MIYLFFSEAKMIYALSLWNSFAIHAWILHEVLFVSTLCPF